jgi:S1 RNA binding domain protein
MELKVGAIIECKVSKVTSFGAFVSLPDGRTGLVHISEIAQEYVKEIRDHLTEEQVVKCKVIGVTEDGKITLSIKKALEAPPVRPAGGRPLARRPSGRGKTWDGRTAPPGNGELSFEDMMSRFKQTSDEKMTDLKRSKDSKRGSSFPKRGGGGSNKF